MRLNRREATKEKQEEMISMALRPAARKRPAVNAAPRSAVVQSDKEVGTGGGFTTRLSSVAQEILAVTDWFDPAPPPKPYPVTVRFSGRRVDVKGPRQSGGRFVSDGTTERSTPRAGPISPSALVA